MAAARPERHLHTVPTPTLPLPLPRFEALPRTRTTRPELATTCPWCRQPPGEPCTTRRGRPLTAATSHPSRQATQETR
jgi:hypothetical protein